MDMEEKMRYFVLKVGDRFIADMRLNEKDHTVQEIAYGPIEEAMLWHSMSLSQHVVDALSAHDEHVEVIDAFAEVFSEQGSKIESEEFFLKKGDLFVTDLKLVNAGTIVRGIRFGERLDAMRFLKEEMLTSTFMASLLEQEPDIRLVQRGDMMETA